MPDLLDELKALVEQWRSQSNAEVAENPDNESRRPVVSLGPYLYDGTWRHLDGDALGLENAIDDALEGKTGRYRVTVEEDSERVESRGAGPETLGALQQIGAELQSDGGFDGASVEREIGKSRGHESRGKVVAELAMGPYEGVEYDTGPALEHENDDGGPYDDWDDTQSSLEENAKDGKLYKIVAQLIELPEGSDG